MKHKLMVFIILYAMSSAVYALEFFSGKVTFLEPTYLPNAIVFSMDSGNATCPAGTHLKWNKADTENNKGVYSTLMTALVSGKKITFHFNNGDANCIGTHIHLLND